MRVWEWFSFKYMSLPNKKQQQQPTATKMVINYNFDNNTNKDGTAICTFWPLFSDCRWISMSHQHELKYLYQTNSLWFWSVLVLKMICFFFFWVAVSSYIKQLFGVNNELSHALMLQDDQSYLVDTILHWKHW